MTPCQSSKSRPNPKNEVSLSDHSFGFSCDLWKISQVGVSYVFELNEQWVLQPDAELTFTKEEIFLSYTLGLTLKF